MLSHLYLTNYCLVVLLNICLCQKRRDQLSTEQHHFTTVIVLHHLQNSKTQHSICIANLPCTTTIIFQKAQSHISMVFGLIPNIHSLLVEQFYTMRTGNCLRMRRKHPISTQPRGHTSTFFQAHLSLLVVYLRLRRLRWNR